MFFTKLVVALIIHIPFIMLTYSLHSIPLKKNARQIAIIGIMLGGAYFYSRFIVETNLFLIVSISTLVLLVMSFRRYPLLYCLAICTTSYFISITIDTILTVTASNLFHINLIEIQSNPIEFLTLNIIFSSIVLAISLILNKYRIGFSYIIRRFSIKHTLSNKNYYWAGFFYCFLMIAQRMVNRIDWSTAIILSSLTLVILFISFKNNKISKNERYDII